MNDLIDPMMTAAICDIYVHGLSAMISIIDLDNSHIPGVF
jgi:hypothetical protein